MRAQESLGPLRQRSFLPSHEPDFIKVSQVRHLGSGWTLNPWHSCQHISAACQAPPDWQGHPPMHQPFLPAWGIFCSFLSFSSEGLLSSCWLDFGSLAAAPSSPLSAVGLCTSRWSCPSLNCQMPRAVCPPRSLPPDMQNWEAREQTLPAETEAKKALSASVLWHEVVLTTSSEPLSSRCPACSSILAYCHVTSKCFGPSGMWKYSFSVWAIHDVAFNLFIFYCKVAFIWKIVLMRYAWLMLITVVIF